MVNNKKMKKIPWYSKEAKLFGKDYLDEYSNVLKPEVTQQEVDFIDKILCFKKKSKILDLCCGHGRHSIELARRGYEVTGQDLNKFFIKIAKEETKKENLNIKFIQSDMRKIPFKNYFDVIVNLFTAFGYLENDKEDEKAIRQIAQALKPKGLFILDTVNKDWLIKIYQERDWQEMPNKTIVLYKRAFNPVTGKNSEERTYISPNGKRKKNNISIRLYTLTELDKILENNGIEIKKVFGDFEGNEFARNSRRMIIVARKTK